MKTLFFILCALSLYIANAQPQRKICISIDDLPTVEYRVPEENHGWKITNGIVDACTKHKVPAIGYVNAGKLFVKDSLIEEKVAYLKKWLDAGMELGNHTYSHKNYHNVPFEEFAQDVLDGEKVVKALVESYGQAYRHFRHPYLRSGADEESTNKLKSFLKENDYQEAFVTVDDDDYLFALAYARAYRKSDQQLMNKIGNAYISYMVEKLKYFEKQSIAVFGRNINHTLLIHANLLNATYLDELLESYKSLGYQFVSQAEAIQDTAYNTPVTTYGNWGISWIDKWAMSAGKSGDFFAEDPKTPEFILELSR